MKIKTKVYTLLASGSLLAALVGGVMFVADRDSTADRQAIQTTEKLLHSAAELRLLGFETMLLHEERAADQWQRKIRSIGNELQALEIAQPSARTALERIRKNIESANAIYADLHFKSAPTANTNAVNAAQEAAFVARSFAALTLVIQDVIDSVIVINRESRHELEQTLRTVRIAVALMLLAMLAQLVFMWRFTRSSILRPLATFVDATQRIAGGDYTVRLNLPQVDEIGTLASAFNVMSMQVQQTNQAIRLEQDNLSITLHSIGDAVIATDAQGCINRMNPVAERLTGWPLSDAAGQPLLDVFRIINAQTRLPVINPVQLVMERGEVVGLANHTVLLARDGHEYQIADSAAPIRDGTGQIVGVVLVFSDVTEKYQTEVALKQSAERLSLAARASRVGIWERDFTLNKTIWDDVMYQLYGIAADQFGGAYETWRAGVHPEDREQSDAEIQMALRGEKEYDTEFRVIWPDGSIHNIRALAIVQRDENGQPLKMIGTNWDITEQKKTEQTIQTSLKEKTALLNEVHHRVKNNLQVITSLLRLEAGRSVQPDTKAVLTDMQGRIRSMALLHETLYRSGIFASIDLGSYLKQLATQSFRALQTNTGAVQLRLELASVKVSMDQATPCGLLVNELISNSLKHGFPDGRSGEVRIALHAEEGTQQVRLSVGDTGIGLPADFDVRQQNSLGLQLVNSLATQLGGNLTIEPGAVFAVIFTAITPEPTTMDS